MYSGVSKKDVSLQLDDSKPSGDSKEDHIEEETKMDLGKLRETEQQEFSETIGLDSEGSTKKVFHSNNPQYLEIEFDEDDSTKPSGDTKRGAAASECVNDESDGENKLAYL